MRILPIVYAVLALVAVGFIFVAVSHLGALSQ